MNNVVYSSENSRLINLWQLSDTSCTGAIQTYPNHHRKTITKLISIPCIETLVSSSEDSNIILWDTITSSPKRTYTSQSRGILSMSFNRDYRLIFSAGYDHDIYVWNPYLDSHEFKLEGHNSSLVGVQVIPDSYQVVSLDIEGWVRIWDIRTFSAAQTFNLNKKIGGKSLRISDFSYLSKTSRLIFGGKKLFQFDYDVNYNPKEADRYYPISTYYCPSSFQIFSGISDKVKIWDAFTSEVDGIYASTKESDISYVAMDEWEKRVIVGTLSGKLSVYNIKTGALMKRLDSHEDEVIYILASNHLGYIISGSIDKVILIHSDISLRDTFIYRKLQFRVIVNVFVVIPNTRVLLTGNTEGKLQFWNVDEGLSGGGIPLSQIGEITCILTVVDHSVIFCSTSSGEVAIWGVEPSPFNYTMILSWINKDEDHCSIPVTTMVYDKSESILFLGDDRGHIKALDFSNVFLLLNNVIEGAKTDVEALVPNDLFDHAIYRYNILVHNEAVRHLHLVKDPKCLISTGFDKKIKVLSTDTGKLLGSIQDKKGEHWGFPLNIKEIEEKTAKELGNIHRSVVSGEDRRKGLINLQFYKGIAHEFIKPMKFNNRKTDKLVNDFMPESPRTLAVKEQRRIKKSKLINTSYSKVNRANHSRFLKKNRLSDLSLSTLQSYGPKKITEKTMQNLSTFPSLSKLYQVRPLDYSNLRKELIKGKYKNSSKLTKIIDKEAP